MENQNSLVKLNFDSEAVKCVVDANESGIIPTVKVVTQENEADVVYTYEKEQLSETVALTSIAEYINKKYPGEKLDEDGLVIYCVHPDRTKLDFYEDPNTKLSTVLKSSLTVNPDFKAFQVNKEVFFSMEGLISLIRTKAYCLKFVADAKALLIALRNFDLKFTMSIEKSDDKQGNTKNNVATSIEKTKMEIPKTLTVSLPLFVSGPKIDIELEIEIQVGKNNMPEFGFYNLDADVTLREQASALVNDEVDKFRTRFVCLEVE